MANERVLVLGGPGLLSRELTAMVNVVEHSGNERRQTQELRDRSTRVERLADVGSLELDRPARARAPVPLRLLLVDDEPLLLRSLQRALGEHHVDIAHGGGEALAQLEQNRSYDLIFCDLMMPDMDGAILFAEIERRMPELIERVVFCSGGAFTARTKHFVETTTRPFVEKPMTRDSFERVVTELLGQRRAAGAPDSPVASAQPAR